MLIMGLKFGSHEGEGTFNATRQSHSGKKVKGNMQVVAISCLLAGLPWSTIIYTFI